MSQETQQPRIMTVDDEAEIIKSIHRFLRFQPNFYNVDFESASTFEEAMEKMEEKSPIIILQDINLPDGNGLQFIRQVKKKYPMVQFIVITGASDLDRVIEALSFGAVDYLKKPLDMEILARVVGEALERSNRWGELLWDEYMSEGGDVAENTGEG